MPPRHPFLCVFESSSHLHLHEGGRREALRRVFSKNPSSVPQVSVRTETQFPGTEESHHLTLALTDDSGWEIAVCIGT